jgi:multiple sugar transport system substrate-binding protein
MRIRILSIAVSLLMVVSLFSACGFAEEELSVTLMAYAGSSKDSTDEAFYQKMSEASGVKVNFIAAPSDYRDNVTKQTTLLSSGDTTVDIFHCDEPMLSTFMNAGFLEPITDAVSANIGAFPQDYVKSMCSKDGEIYAVPTEVQPVILFVNRTVREGGHCLPQDRAGVHRRGQGADQRRRLRVWRRLDKGLHVQLPGALDVRF